MTSRDQDGRDGRAHHDPGLEGGVLALLVMAALLVVGSLFYVLNNPSNLTATRPGSSALSTTGQGNAPAASAPAGN